MTLKSFETSGKAAVKIAATVASASGALDGTSNAVRVVNSGPNSCRIKFSGPSGAALPATANDMLLLPNTSEIFSKGSATFVAAICDVGTAAVEFTDGEGI